MVRDGASMSVILLEFQSFSRIAPQQRQICIDKVGCSSLRRHCSSAANWVVVKTRVPFGLPNYKVPYSEYVETYIMGFPKSKGTRLLQLPKCTLGSIQCPTPGHIMSQLMSHHLRIFKHSDMFFSGEKSSASASRWNVGAIGSSHSGYKKFGPAIKTVAQTPEDYNTVKLLQTCERLDHTQGYTTSGESDDWMYSARYHDRIPPRLFGVPIFRRRIVQGCSRGTSSRCLQRSTATTACNVLRRSSL